MRVFHVGTDQFAEIDGLPQALPDVARAANDSYMKQLDSLRQYAGVDLSERARLTESDREALKRFEEWARPVTESIRVNNDGARAEIRNALQPLQLARADSINRANRELRGRRPEERRR